jgi:hypothetical protein
LINDSSTDGDIFVENNLNNIIAAEFQAFVLLSNSLNKKINTLKNKSDFKYSAPQQKSIPSQLNWSLAISKCVEICYALFLSNAINDGKATLKQITEKLGEAFNIDLSDYAQSMKYIKKRKRDGLFLTEMTNTLLQFISNHNH